MFSISQVRLAQAARGRPAAGSAGRVRASEGDVRHLQERQRGVQGAPEGDASGERGRWGRRSRWGVRWGRLERWERQQRRRGLERWRQRRWRQRGPDCVNIRLQPHHRLPEEEGGAAANLKLGHLKNHFSFFKVDLRNRPLRPGRILPTSESPAPPRNPPSSIPPCFRCSKMPAFYMSARGLVDVGQGILLIPPQMEESVLANHKPSF